MKNINETEKTNSKIIFEEDIDIRSKNNNNHHITFNYQSEKYGAFIEISGQLIEFDSGRDYEFRVEPDTIEDKIMDNIWSENWEDIEQEIIDAYWESVKS